MALSLSNRSPRIAQAEIRSMSLECEKVGGINLAQGVCDTETPLPVREAAKVGIDRGVNSYTRFDELAQLRQAIAQKLPEYNGINADPETEIVVSAGSCSPGGLLRSRGCLTTAWQDEQGKSNVLTREGPGGVRAW